MAKNIIVDIDGVVSAYDFPYLIKKYFGVAVPNKDVMFYSLEDSLGLPNKDIMAMFAEAVHDPPNMVPGATKALEELILNDYEVLIYSNRLHFMEQWELEDWLARYEIPHCSVLTKDTLPSYAWAAIDDSPSKLLDIQENVKVTMSLLYKNPWNENCQNILGKMKMVKNWKEVLNEIYGRTDFGREHIKFKRKAS